MRPHFFHAYLKIQVVSDVNSHAAEKMPSRELCNGGQQENMEAEPDQGGCMRRCKCPTCSETNRGKNPESTKKIHILGEKTQENQEIKSPSLNHPFRLVICLPVAISPHRYYTEILCKRMSWIVAQTIVRQLVSVVNTSI